MVFCQITNFDLKALRVPDRGMRIRHLQVNYEYYDNLCDFNSNVLKLKKRKIDFPHVGLIIICSTHSC